jgi:hypothetical protein
MGSIKRKVRKDLLTKISVKLIDPIAFSIDFTLYEQHIPSEDVSGSEEEGANELPEGIVNDMVQYLLIMDRKKIPIKRAGNYFY